MSKDNQWPAWRFGPGGKSDVFQSEKDVPAGWVDHPTKVKEAPKASKPAATPAPAATDGVTLDADGHPWSAELHVAKKTLTSAGLWRMKPGVSRPAPVKAAAPLDL